MEKILNFEVRLVAIRRKMRKREVRDFWDFWIILFAVVVNILNDWAFPTLALYEWRGCHLEFYPTTTSRVWALWDVSTAVIKLFIYCKCRICKYYLLKCSPRCILLNVTHLTYNTGNSRNRTAILKKKTENQTQDKLFICLNCRLSNSCRTELTASYKVQENVYICFCALMYALAYVFN